MLFFSLPSCGAQTAEAVVAKLKALVPTEEITRAILVLRRHRVLLDSELAALYDVTTKRLNEQVKRNARRFPQDFVFRLTRAETEVLNRSQNATGSRKHRDPRSMPYAFTEHGAIMAATILNSPRAVEMSVYVVRAFVQLREMLASNKELARRFAPEQAITALVAATSTHRQKRQRPQELRQSVPRDLDADAEQ
jgi:hypothetical protein